MGERIERLRRACSNDPGFIPGGWIIDTESVAAALAEHDAEVAALRAQAERAEAARQRDAGLAEEHIAAAREATAEERRTVAAALDKLTRVEADRDHLAAELARLHKLFDDAGQGEHNVLALVDHYQEQALDRDRLAAELAAERGSGGVLAREECGNVARPIISAPDLPLEWVQAGARAQRARDVARVRAEVAKARAEQDDFQQGPHACIPGSLGALLERNAMRRRSLPRRSHRDADPAPAEPTGTVRGTVEGATVTVTTGPGITAEELRDVCIRAVEEWQGLGCIDWKTRAEKAEAGLGTQIDCGQDGVCKLSPGCNRHWEERNRELVRERDEAWAFLRRTAITGGSIVSSAAMTAQQIAIARAADRMLVMPDGYGFVYVPGPRFCACGRPEPDCDQSRAACPRTDHTSEDDESDIIIAGRQARVGHVETVARCTRLPGGWS